MKVIPSNQTLILAGEGGARNAVRGSVLQRVTVIASRPDDTLLYLRADYSAYVPPADAPARARLSPAASASKAMEPAPVASRRVTLSTRSGGPYTGSRGIELYASTQQILAARPAANLDVHA